MTPSAAELLGRARAEYLEMPGLCLTLAQAQRLWALDSITCLRLLSDLVDQGFLKQRANRTYVRLGTGWTGMFSTSACSEADHACGHPGE